MFPSKFVILISDFPKLAVTSSNRGGFESGTTSCKRHEMSSKKLCGEGWVERGHTYLKRERLGLGLIEPLVTRVG